MRIWNLFEPGFGIRNLFDPGSWIRDGNIQIRDKHPPSATLTDTQVCFFSAPNTYFPAIRGSFLSFEREKVQRPAGAELDEEEPQVVAQPALTRPLHAPLPIRERLVAGHHTRHHSAAGPSAAHRMWGLTATRSELRLHKYTDGLLVPPKGYAEGLLVPTKSYSDGLLVPTKGYADGLLISPKGYTDGLLVPTKSHAEGLLVSMKGGRLPAPDTRLLYGSYVH
jgi:hypothetical protein